MNAGTPVTSASRRAVVRWQGTSTVPRRRSAVRRIVTGLGVALSGLVVLALFGLAAALTVVPAVAGGHTLTVLSGSMVPALRPGSIVVDRPVDAARLRVGDVITFGTVDQNTGVSELVTHRVVAIRRDQSGLLFTTRGDANDVADQLPVRSAQIRGTLWYDVPYVGYVRDALRANGIGMIAGAIVLLLAGAWLLRWSGWPYGRRAESDAPRRDRT